MTSKIIRADGVTELTGIKSVTFHETVNADTDLRPGCVASSFIEVVCFGDQTDAPTAGEELTYYQVVGLTQTLIGKFYATPSIPSKATFSFTAYDAAIFLDADFSAWLSANQSNFPYTVKQLVTQACTIAGVTLGSSSWAMSTMSVNAFYADGITCRNILQYAAEIAGCFVRCNTSGALTFGWYSSVSNKRIYPSSGSSGSEVRYAYKQGGLNYANYDTTALARVTVHPVGEDDVAYIYPTGVSTGNTLSIKNNALLYGASAANMNAIAQNVYTVMSALGSYRPMTASLFPNENPFRAGDIVPVTDVQGVSFTTVVMSQTVSDSEANLVSTGHETYNDVSVDTGKKLVQLAADIVQINKLKVDWADINTAIINYLTANNVTAQNLSIVDEYGNVLATFDASGITLGNSSKTHAEISYNAFTLYNKNGTEYLLIGDMRDQSGETIIIDTFVGSSGQSMYYFSYTTNYVAGVVAKVNGVTVTPDATYANSVVFVNGLTDGDVLTVEYTTTDPLYQFLFGSRKIGTNHGAYSVGMGQRVDVSGNLSFVGGGSDNSATGNKSAVIGGQLNKSSGEMSSVLGGNGNTSSGKYALVVGGVNNDATEDYSSVVNGYQNSANGYLSSIVGGAENETNGMYSAILGGQGNVANSRSQVAFGEYNQSGNFIETVGNGSSDSSRSNARTLDWSGNETLAGGLTLGVPLGIADGGTGQTGTTSDSTWTNIITPSAGTTINNAYAYKWGKVVQIYINFKLDANLSTSSAKLIGTMKSGYRPAVTCFTTASQPTVACGYVADGGGVNLRGTLPSNTSASIYATFITP